MFSATIERACPIYSDKLKPTGAQLDIKVEYFLEKGQPAIATEKYWRCVPCPNGETHTSGSFFTKVAGVTFEGRQRVVARCSVGERLVLVRDPNNRFDKGAIRVLRSNGEQLGFIPSHVSRSGNSSGLAFRMDRGDTYHCRISDITGGGWGKHLGVNIEIIEGGDVGSQDTSPVGSGAEQRDGSLGWVVVVVGVVLVSVVLISHGC